MEDNILKLSEDGKTLLGVTDRSIKEVVIPQGVTAIGEKAFGSCHDLQHVVIPDSVTSIEDLAFAFCGLQNIVISEHVVSIGQRAFVFMEHIEVSPKNPRYTSVDGVLFDKGMTTIMQYPSKKKDERYTIPHTVKTIADGAFLRCKSLITIEIPNSVTSIGDDAFYHCTSLRNINIPDGVTTIGNRAFASCTALRIINIPKSVTYIGSHTLDGCPSLKRI